MFFNKLLVDGFLPPNRQIGSFISPSFGMSQYYKQYLSCHSADYHTFAFFDPSPSPGPPQKNQGCLMISPAKRQFRQAFSGPTCRCMEVVTKRAASESN